MKPEPEVKLLYGRGRHDSLLQHGYSYNSGSTGITNTMTENLRLTDLKLSLQRVLLGAVSQGLVGVTAGIDGIRITVSAYFDAPVTSENLDQISTVAAEVAADFPECDDVEFHAELADDRTGGGPALDFWAFVRCR